MIGLMKRLFYLSGVYSIGSLFEMALAFFFIPLYTAYLGTYEYGIVGLMSITIGLISRVITPPVTGGFIRFYHAPEYREEKGLLLFNGFIFLLLQASVLSLIFYLLSGPISRYILDDNSLTYIVRVYAVILFFQSLSEYLLTVLRQKEQARFVILLSWGKFISSVAVVVIGLVYLDIGVLALIYGVLVGVILDVVCIIPALWKEITPQLSLSVLRQPLRYGYPLIGQGLSNILIQSGDRYILKLFSPLSVVGLYSFGYTFAGIILVALVMPLKHALQPLVLKQEGKPEQLKAFVRSNCTYFYLLGMFLCLLLSLYSKEAIEIMARDREFWGSWVIVPIIAFANLQHGVGNFLGWGVRMAKKSFIVSSNVLITACINIILNILFIPPWGIIGAATATLLSYMVWNGLKLYYSARYYDLHFDLTRLGHITLVGVTLYVLSLFITTTDSLFVNMAIKFLIVLSYPLLILGTGFLTGTEKVYLKKLYASLREVGVRETVSRIRAI
jgi:O-antigen/teichoic acid export membrane protein